MLFFESIKERGAKLGPGASICANTGTTKIAARKELKRFFGFRAHKSAQPRKQMITAVLMNRNAEIAKNRVFMLFHPIAQQA